MGGGSSKSTQEDTGHQLRLHAHRTSEPWTVESEGEPPSSISFEVTKEKTWPINVIYIHDLREELRANHIVSFDSGDVLDIRFWDGDDYAWKPLPSNSEYFRVDNPIYIIVSAISPPEPKNSLSGHSASVPTNIEVSEVRSESAAAALPPNVVSRQEYDDLKEELRMLERKFAESHLEEKEEKVADATGTKTESILSKLMRVRNLAKDEPRSDALNPDASAAALSTIAEGKTHGKSALSLSTQRQLDDGAHDRENDDDGGADDGAVEMVPSSRKSGPRHRPSGDLSDDALDRPPNSMSRMHDRLSKSLDPVGSLMSNGDFFGKRRAAPLVRPPHIADASNHELEIAGATNDLPEYDRLDMAILDSSPLVMKDLSARTGQFRAFNAQPLGQSFREFRFVSALRKSKSRLSVRFEIASRKTLSEIVIHKPRVLHIRCHGGFRPRVSRSPSESEDGNADTGSGTDEEFFLAFEDEIGALDYFTLEDLKNVLQTSKNFSNVDLVLINSCYSFQAARLFKEAGVPNVVGVHSATRVLDSACEDFARFFYLRLIKSSTVLQAFEGALKSVSSTSVSSHSCCCAHSHKPDCKWFHEVKPKLGRAVAHDFHIPDSRCKCPEKADAYHDHNCKWVKSVRSLMVKFSEPHKHTMPHGHSVLVTQLGRDITTRELAEIFRTAGTVHSVQIPSKKSGRIDGYGIVRFEKATAVSRAIQQLDCHEVRGHKLHVAPLRFCCCSPELPHRERTKFHLLSNKKHSSQKIFNRVPEGKFMADVPLPPFEPLSTPQPFVGRSLLIFRIVHVLTRDAHRPLVVIHGKPGSGKLTLAKAIANHIYERPRYQFDRGVLMVDLASRKSTDEIFFSLSRKLDLEIQSEKDLFQALHGWKCLIVFYHCQMIIDQGFDDFMKFLHELMEQNSNVRVLITTQSMFDVERCVAHKLTVSPFEVPLFDDSQAFETFRALAKKNLDANMLRNPHKLRSHEIFRLMKHKDEDGTRPQDIWSIAQALAMKTLDQIATDIRKRRSGALDGGDGSWTSAADEKSQMFTLSYSLHLILHAVQDLERGTDALRLIALLSLFRNGLMEDDIDSIWRDGDWRSLMRGLLNIGVNRRLDTTDAMSTTTVGTELESSPTAASPPSTVAANASEQPLESKLGDENESRIEATPVTPQKSPPDRTGGAFHGDQSPLIGLNTTDSASTMDPRLLQRPSLSNGRNSSGGYRSSLPALWIVREYHTHEKAYYRSQRSNVNNGQSLKRDSRYVQTPRPHELPPNSRDRRYGAASTDTNVSNLSMELKQQEHNRAMSGASCTQEDTHALSSAFERRMKYYKINWLFFKPLERYFDEIDLESDRRAFYVAAVRRFSLRSRTMFEILRSQPDDTALIESVKEHLDFVHSYNFKEVMDSDRYLDAFGPYEADLVTGRLHPITHLSYHFARIQHSLGVSFKGVSLVQKGIAAAIRVDDKVAECYMLCLHGELYLQQNRINEALLCFSSAERKTQEVRQEVREKFNSYLRGETQDASSAIASLQQAMSSAAFSNSGHVIGQGLQENANDVLQTSSVGSFNFGPSGSFVTGQHPQQFQALAYPAPDSSLGTVASMNAMTASMMYRPQPMPPSPIISSVGFLAQEQEPPVRRAVCETTPSGDSSNMFSPLSSGSSPSRSSTISDLTEIDEKSNRSSFEQPVYRSFETHEMDDDHLASTRTGTTVDEEDSPPDTVDSNASQRSQRHSVASRSSRQMSSFDYLSELDSPVHRAVEAGSGTDAGSGPGSGPGTVSSPQRSTRTSTSSRSRPATAAAAAAASARASSQHSTSPSLTPSDPGPSKSPSRAPRKSVSRQAMPLQTRSHSQSLSLPRDRSSTLTASATSGAVLSARSSHNAAQSPAALAATSESVLASQLASHSFSSATSSSSITTLASHRRSHRSNPRPHARSSFSRTGSQSFADVLSGAGRANPASHARSQPLHANYGRESTPARPVNTVAAPGSVSAPSETMSAAPSGALGITLPGSVSTTPSPLHTAPRRVHSGTGTGTVPAVATSMPSTPTAAIPIQGVPVPSHTTSMHARVAPLSMSAQGRPFLPHATYSPRYNAPNFQTGSFQPVPPSVVSAPPSVVSAPPSIVSAPPSGSFHAPPPAASFPHVRSGLAASLHTYGLHQNTPPPSSSSFALPHSPVAHGVPQHLQQHQQLPPVHMPTPGTPTARTSMRVGALPGSQVSQIPSTQVAQYAAAAMMPNTQMGQHSVASMMPTSQPAQHSVAPMMPTIQVAQQSVASMMPTIQVAQQSVASMMPTTVAQPSAASMMPSIQVPQFQQQQHAGVSQIPSQTYSSPQYPFTSTSAAGFSMANQDSNQQYEHAPNISNLPSMPQFPGGSSGPAPSAQAILNMLRLEQQQQQQIRMMDTVAGMTPPSSAPFPFASHGGNSPTVGGLAASFASPDSDNLPAMPTIADVDALPLEVPVFKNQQSEEYNNLPEYFLKFEARLYKSHGDACARSNYPVHALPKFTQAYALFARIGDKLWAARSLAELAKVNLELFMLKKPMLKIDPLSKIIADLKKACAWFREKRDFGGVADCHIALAKAYFEWEHYAEALASVKSAIHMYPKHAISRMAIADALNLRQAITAKMAALEAEVGNFVVFMRSAPLVYRLAPSQEEEISESSQLAQVDSIDWFPNAADEWGKLLHAARREKLKIQRLCALPSNLKECIHNGCRILHFSCHGSLPSDETGLLLEEEDGAARLIHASGDDNCELNSFLCDAGGLGAYLVFLSCVVDRKVALAFLRNNAKYVIIGKDQDFIESDAASGFLTTFYREVFLGKSAFEAFFCAEYELGEECKGGYELLEISQSGDDVIPLRSKDERQRSSRNLLMSPVFEKRRSGSIISLASSFTTATVGTARSTTPDHLSNAGITGEPAGAMLPKLVDLSARTAPTNLKLNKGRGMKNFCGRNVEMYRVLATLANYRVVNIYGLEGMGKTAMSVAIAHYCLNRDKYQHGVFLVSLNDCLSTVKIRTAISRELNLRCQNFADLLDQLKKREILLILDDCSGVDRSACLNFAWFITSVMALEKVHLILISRDRLAALEKPPSEIHSTYVPPGEGADGGLNRTQSFAEKPICLEIYPLQPFPAAALFYSLAPRSLRAEEFPGFESHDDFEYASKREKVMVLSKDPIFDQLMGHPLSITRAAGHLQDHRLDEMDDIFVQPNPPVNDTESLISSLGGGDNGDDEIFGFDGDGGSIDVSFNSPISQKDLRREQRLRGSIKKSRDKLRREKRERERLMEREERARENVFARLSQNVATSNASARRGNAGKKQSTRFDDFPVTSVAGGGKKRGNSDRVSFALSQPAASRQTSTASYTQQRRQKLSRGGGVPPMVPQRRRTHSNATSSRGSSRRQSLRGASPNSFFASDAQAQADSAGGDKFGGGGVATLEDFLDAHGHRVEESLPRTSGPETHSLNKPRTNPLTHNLNITAPAARRWNDPADSDEDTPTSKSKSKSASKRKSKIRSPSALQAHNKSTPTSIADTAALKTRTPRSRGKRSKKAKHIRSPPSPDSRESSCLNSDVEEDSGSGRHALSSRSASLSEESQSTRASSLRLDKGKLVRQPSVDSTLSSTQRRQKGERSIQLTRQDSDLSIISQTVSQEAEWLVSHDDASEGSTMMPLSRKQKRKKRAAERRRQKLMQREASEGSSVLGARAPPLEDVPPLAGARKVKPSQQQQGDGSGSAQAAKRKKRNRKKQNRRGAAAMAANS